MVADDVEAMPDGRSRIAKPKHKLYGRIFRKYAANISAVAICLSLVSGAIHVRTSYENARNSALDSLNAKAELAALVANNFIDETRSAISQLAHLNILPANHRERLRDLEHIRIQKFRPEIVELFYISNDGEESHRISRRSGDTSNQSTDIERTKILDEVSTNKFYLSSVFFHRGSEPRVTMAVSDAGRNPGVTVAEISLLSLSEELAKAGPGKTGYMFATDKKGQLTSHSETSLVLANISFLNDARHNAALSEMENSSEIREAVNYLGQKVYYTYKYAPSLNWIIFAEISVREALAPFYSALIRSSSILLLGLGVALIATFILARRMVVPINALHAAAERMAHGDFDSFVEIKTKDELGQLAKQFNIMAQQILRRDLALRASEERYALATLGASDGIWDWDITGKTVYYSGRWRTMVGDPDVPTTSSLDYWLKRIVPEDRTHVIAAIDSHVTRCSEFLRCEYRVLLPDGSYKWMLARAVATRSTEGHALRMAGSQTDVTALKHALADLENYRDHLEALVEQRTTEAQAARNYLLSAIHTAPDGLIMLDQDEKTIVANARCMELLAPKSAQLSSYDQVDPLEHIASTNSDCGLKIAALYQQGLPFVNQLEVNPASWVEIRGRKMASGGYVIRMSDVSAYKEAENTLRIALEKEVELNAVQRNFVSMTSHQFRTPLAIIDSSAQRLVRRSDQVDHAEIARRALLIRDAVGRMTRLMESTLSLSLVDAGVMSFNPIPFDLKELIRTTCELHGEVIASRTFDIHIERLPPRVNGDPTLIEQVLTNLVSNAIKFSMEGSVIQIEGWSEYAQAVFSVSNPGIGIPADERDKIFQRFFRARNAAGIIGSGIGLNMVREIIEMHGGRIELAAAEANATTFIVRVPLHRHRDAVDDRKWDGDDGAYPLH